MLARSPRLSNARRSGRISAASRAVSSSRARASPSSLDRALASGGSAAAGFSGGGWRGSTGASTFAWRPESSAMRASSPPSDRVLPNIVTMRPVPASPYLQAEDLALLPDAGAAQSDGEPFGLARERAARRCDRDRLAGIRRRSGGHLCRATAPRRTSCRPPFRTRPCRSRRARRRRPKSISRPGTAAHARAGRIAVEPYRAARRDCARRP